MQEEFYPVAEKILLDIQQLFIKDPKLKSFEIIPLDQSENRSPILYEDHCLGLESWCVPHIFYYAYKNLMTIRETKRKTRDVDKCNTLLIGALLINPDITTLWNMRKQLINSGKLDPYFDLHFTSVVLTYKPKCADIYSFRKWVIQKIMQDSMCTTLLDSEMEICEAAADRYSNNYHAWTHRIWCLSQSVPTLLQGEWAASLRWVQRHVSDYSGFHYRQKLITSLLGYITTSSYDNESIKLIAFSVDEATESFLHNIKNLELSMQRIPLILKIFIYELSLDSDLIWNFIGHEALWCHRRFIFYEIKKALFDGNTGKRAWGYFETSNHSTIDGVPNEKTQKIGMDNVSDQFSLILSHYEDIFLRKCFDKSEPRQMYYAHRHKDWLTKFCDFQLPYNSSDIQNFNIEISSLAV